MIAAPIISFAPSVNASAISFGANLPTKPLIIPNPRKTAAICGIQNSNFKTPYTTNAIDVNNAAIIILCLKVNSVCSDSVLFNFSRLT